MNSFSRTPKGGGKHYIKNLLTLLLMLWSVTGFTQLYTDVKLQSGATPAQVSLGENIGFSIKILNEGHTELTGLSVKIEPITGVVYASHLAPAGTSYDPLTGVWQIGEAMTQSVDFLELTIETTASLEGVSFLQAQVFTLNEIDVDSEPGNNFFPEDDHTSSCATVPYSICTADGESVTLTAPPGLSGYQWYLDDGNSMTLVSTDSLFVATQPGSYSFLANANACAAGMCCPIVLTENCAQFFDLALEKTLAPGQPAIVDIGDEVTYLLTLTNEGAFPAYNVEVTDHVPVGMALGTNALNWVLNGAGDATYTIAGPILPGESAAVEIVFQVMYGASEAAIWNTAEVTRVTDIDGNPMDDVDSTPDNGEDDEDDQDAVVIELEPHDPTGYFYCENDGSLVMGASITVTGPGQVFIVSDGSTGYYEFYTDGTPGNYQLSYNLPQGYLTSPNCLPLPGAFDPTGLPGPVVLGADTLGGLLSDFSCGANPFYLSFDLEPGDPFIFNNNIPLVCPMDIIAEDSVTLSVNCEISDPLFCFNVPYDELGNYSFELNGEPFEAEFGPCDYLKGRYYTYGALLGFGNDGPYRLEYWNVGGMPHTADFQNMNELVDLMNQWDPLGNWEHDPVTKSLIGGLRQTFYSKLNIRKLSTGTVAVLDLYELYAHNSSYLILPEGENTLVVTNADGVTDTVFIRAACVTPEYVEISLPVGQMDTLCLGLDELQGGVVAIFNPCLEGFDEPADLVVIEGTNCVEILGLYVGQTGACYVICDELGICDTTYITVTVYDDGFSLVPDSLCTPKDVPITGEVLLNDQLPPDIVSVNILTPPQHGTVVVNPDHTITYVPDEGYCNDKDDLPLDTFVYEVCTSFECESAVVYVTVKCDGLIVYNGFSPNGDGVNDFFKIDGLELYESHKILVFNRWGNRVFRSENYRNDWDGYWFEKRLPSGTYFYLIELNDGEQWLSGYVQIRW